MTGIRKSVRAFTLAFVLCILLAGSGLAYADDVDSSANDAQGALATQSEGGDAVAQQSVSDEAQTGTVDAAGGMSSAESAASGTNGGSESGSIPSSDNAGSTTEGAESGTTDASSEVNPADTKTDASGNTVADATQDDSQAITDQKESTDNADTGSTAANATTAAASVAAQTTAAATAAVQTTAAATVANKTTTTGGVIANGTYIINLDKNRDLVLQVEGSSKKAKALVQMKKDKNSKSQRWVFTWLSKYNAYTIKNAYSGYYLTAKVTKAGKKLIYQAKLKSTNKKQMWVLQKTGNGYKIVSRAKTSVGLGTWSSKARDSYYITTQTKAANKFKFYLLPVDEDLKKPASTVSGDLNGKFVKLNLNSDATKSITIEGEAQDAGAAALLGAKKSTQSQKWYLDCVSAKDGLYRIINVGSGKALQAAGKKWHLNTGITQGDPSSSSKLQQWWITKNADGSYRFTNRFNGLSLRTTNTSSGAKMSLFYKPSAKTRDFKAQEISAISNGTKEILLGGSTTQALTVSGSSATKGVQLIAKKYNSELGQKFRLTMLSDGSYSILALCSNLLLTDSGSKLIQGASTDSANQRWNLVWQRVTFSLRNAGTGAFLNVANGAKDNTKVTTASSYNATQGRVLMLDKHIIDNGDYYISYGKGGNSVLGIAAKNASKSKATLNSFTKQDTQNLKFRFAYVSTDKNGREVYRILNSESEMALTSSGSSLYQQKWSGANSQKWTLSLSADGGMAFVNVSTGKAISNANSTKSTVAYDMDSTSSTGVASAANRWALTPTVALNSYQKKAYNKVLKNYSKTNYAIMIDMKNHRLMVFSRQNKSAAWTMKYDWSCSCGKKSTPTPVMSVLSTGYKRKASPSVSSRGLEHNSSFYYMTYISQGKYIHTPLYKKGSHTVYKDTRLGKSISNGCVRVADKNAIWVYKNIKKGTRIMTYK